jgi:hypothetical protein
MNRKTGERALAGIKKNAHKDWTPGFMAQR